MRKEYELVSQRVNIGPGARDIMNKGLPKSPREPKNPNSKFTDTEAKAYWIDHVQEAYQITAVMSDISIARSVQLRPQFPPYGLVRFGRGRMEDITTAPYPEDMQDLRRSFKESLGVGQFLAISELDSKMAKKSKEPMVAVYKRYMDLFTFARNNLASSIDAIIDINAGVNTASYILNWTLENIIEVYERDFGHYPTIEEFEGIAKNSWSYIAGRAAGHRHGFSMESDPKMHILVPKNRGLMISFTKEAELAMEKGAMKKSVADRDLHPVYGCPALVNFGDGSAIQKLWDWNIDDAVTLYKMNSKGRPLGPWFINKEVKS